MKPHGDRRGPGGGGGEAVVVVITGRVERQILLDALAQRAEVGGARCRVVVLEPVRRAGERGGRWGEGLCQNAGLEGAEDDVALSGGGTADRHGRLPRV